MTTDGEITAAGEVEGEEMSQDMVNVTEALFLWTRNAGSSWRRKS